MVDQEPPRDPSGAEAVAGPTGQARVEPPTWGEPEEVPGFNDKMAAATAELDGVALDTERAREFGAIYAGLESYSWRQLSSSYESADYTLDEGAESSLIYDLFDTGLFELFEGEEIRLPSPKFEVSIPLPEPDSGFIRLSDTPQRRTIRLGITFEGESEGQPSEDFGIEVDLAKADGTVSIYESHTSPDGTPQGVEERMKTEKAQSTPDQMRNIARILDKYSPSGDIHFRRRIRESILHAERDAKEGKGYVLSDSRSRIDALLIY